MDEGAKLNKRGSRCRRGSLYEERVSPCWVEGCFLSRCIVVHSLSAFCRLDE